MEEESKEVLKSLGLSKNEIEIYLDLLKSGKSTATDIAKSTKIHRTNVYGSIEKLIEKGFITKTYENNKKTFYPINPKYIIEYYRQKEQELEKIIPFVEKIYNNPIEERKITILNGIKPIKNTFNQITEETKNIYILGAPKEITSILDCFNISLSKKRKKEAIKIKLIYNRDAEKKLKQLINLEQVEARFLPSDFSSNVTTIICNDKVMIIFWEVPITAIFSKDKSIAESYKKYFSIIWREAKIEIV